MIIAGSQAFGVGALEDDDDDIYSLDHMSNYDRVIEEEDKRNQTHGWTAPKHTGWIWLCGRYFPQSF